jgi:glycosyltransferase involved in cell wall biosynthesis
LSRVEHVFPYDPRHLGQGFERWAASQLERWPLAAVRRSQQAERTTVRVIGPRSRIFDDSPLTIREHRALFTGPRFRDWGDDWSPGLGRALRRLGAEDVCVVHMNDYAAARFAQQAASKARVVIVFHGAGLGRHDEHLTLADRLVVLSDEATDGLRALGIDTAKIAVLRPSVDLSRFTPANGELGSPVLGFVGRLDPAKGILDLPQLVAALHGARAEIVGPARPGDRAALDEAIDRAGVRERVDVLGELRPDEVAARLRAWRLMLMPSYSEGHPIVVLEACASRLPVAAVSGVLPAELESRPGVFTAPREQYGDLVARLLEQTERPPQADWVTDHSDGAAAWDSLLRDLPPWSPRRVPISGRLARAKRFRPLRRGVRRLRATFRSPPDTT